MTSTTLINAINACCDARGDDDWNRAALIAEGSCLPAAEQHDLQQHFEHEARAWRRACAGSADIRPPARGNGGDL